MDIRRLYGSQIFNIEFNGQTQLLKEKHSPRSFTIKLVQESIIDRVN